jgi:hypothetical protein
MYRFLHRINNGDIFAYFALDMKSSYKYLCRFERRHITICSYFFGNCFSTSVFSLRSRNGLNTCKSKFPLNYTPLLCSECLLTLSEWDKELKVYV